MGRAYKVLTHGTEHQVGANTVLGDRSVTFERISEQITVQARLKEYKGASRESIPEETKAGRQP